MTTTTSGRTALVTGGASGIGFACAQLLGATGVRVAITDVDGSRLDNAKQALEPLSVLAVAGDVTDYRSVERVVAEVAERLGPVDILVCCAGIGGENHPLWEMPLDEWAKVIDVDLTGVFHACRAVVPTMIDRGWGRIVNIASVAGKEGNPMMSAYSAAKAGLIGLTKSLAKEVAQQGILVNCVTPAVIATPMNEQVTPEVLERLVSRIPMGRVGQPEEVAAMVAWLCSDACSFTTGAVVDISGGRATY